MSKPKESLFNRLMTIFKPVNLMIFTADEKTLDFYELNDDEIPEVGNKAKIDGKPVQDVYTDGLVKLPNGEVYKFEGETLVEKIPAGDVEDKLTTEQYEQVIEQAGIANKALKDEVSTLKNKLSKYEKVENSFKGTEKNKPDNKKETRNSFEEALRKFKKQ